MPALEVDDLLVKAEPALRRRAHDLSRRSGVPAEDLMQEAYLAALKAWPQYNSERSDNPVAFLAGKGHFGMLDYLRTRMVFGRGQMITMLFRHTMTPDAEEADADSMEPTLGLDDEGLQEADVRDLIEAAKLNERELFVVEHRLNGYTGVEIAKMIGVTHQAVNHYAIQAAHRISAAWKGKKLPPRKRLGTMRKAQAPWDEAAEQEPEAEQPAETAASEPGLSELLPAPKQRTLDF